MQPNAKTEKIINEIRNALDIIAKENGVTFRVPAYRYNDSSINFSCEFKIESEQQSFEKLAPLFGLNADIYGKKMKLSSGEMATIYGINNNNYKMPILVRCDNGLHFKCTVDSVKLALAIKEQLKIERISK